jgi:uncharacterized protein
MDPSVHAEISTLLEHARVQYNVAIPHAIESGSRAWGFPSPDSDYDCRFIYVPTIDNALSLFAQRDVIELPMTDVLDINGWELRKAIRLLLKGNAVAIEWLRSPIYYHRNDAFLATMNELVTITFQRGALANHYRRLLSSNLHDHLSDVTNVNLKKVFYALRAAMALRYLRLNSQKAEVPMTLQDLCAGSDLNPSFQKQIDDMVATKAITREMGMGPLHAAFAAFFATELELGLTLAQSKEQLQPDTLAQANAIYLRLLKSHAPV